MILPTILLGRLVDYHVKLSASTEANLRQLKTAQVTNVGLTKNPLTAEEMLISCCQCSHEKAEEFADNLKKLSNPAYPDNKVTSDISL